MTELPAESSSLAQLDSIWPRDERDPLHGFSSPESLWSTTNVAEALPGVPTPLSWTVWGRAVDQSLRALFHSLGALHGEEAKGPAGPEDLTVGIFYGRPAARAEFFCRMGDRLPGTSGAAVAKQMFGCEPEGLVSRPDRRYYPLVLTRLPWVFIRSAHNVRRVRDQTESWWKARIPQLGEADRDEAIALFAEAVRQFDGNVFAHAIANLSRVQPVYDRLARLAGAFGDPGDGLMSAYGAQEETHMVVDLWECARGKFNLDVFLERHGYHGPSEGEMSSRTWREDRTPLERLLEGYESLSDDADPVTAEAVRLEQRRAAERALLLALPRSRRAEGRVLLALAPRCIPLRGTGKVAFLQALDVARAAARRLGVCLAREGNLAEPDDVFFLTSAEVAQCPLPGVQELVAFRRQRYEAYQQLEVPVLWRGLPEPRVPPTEDAALAEVELGGVAASPGVVEGRVRVILDPAAAEIVPGEILVARTTDPSWASIMFLSSALVMDIGGLLSHAAVIARELGLPCVADTKVATRVLRTGDLCRVDGTRGTVQLLERA